MPLLSHRRGKSIRQKDSNSTSIDSGKEFVDAEARGGDTDELISHAPQPVGSDSTREEIGNLRHAVARERLGDCVAPVSEREHFQLNDSNPGFHPSIYPFQWRRKLEIVYFRNGLEMRAVHRPDALHDTGFLRVNRFGHAKPVID